MTNTEAHSLTVNHQPLDAPGVRTHRPGDSPVNDVNVRYLREILESSEDNLRLTEAALASPATRELAQAVRAALLGLDAISFHLLEFHRGVADGSVNYHEDPREGYPGA